MLERSIYSNLTPKDQLKMRIESLHPLVRAYLAVDFALQNPILDKEVKEGLESVRPQLTNELKAELHIFQTYERNLSL